MNSNLQFIKDPKDKELLKVPEISAVKIYRSVATVGMSFLNVMQLNMNYYYKVQSDAKADIARIADKIHEY